MNERIIIIEDDQGVRFFLEEALKGEGYKVSSFESYEDAVKSISNGTGLVIMDISLPGMDGLSATTDIKKKHDVPILIITAYGTKKNALEAIKRGATDFFVKPILLDELKVMLKRILGTRKLKKEVGQLREKEMENHVFRGVVGKSFQMKEIFKEVEKVAGKGLSILVTGETGVGKEEIAKLILLLSRRKGEFVVVNCASIPDNLLESELFGYEKGAFTGARTEGRKGYFDEAHEGTILLDEIGDSSLSVQSKLLRVLESGTFKRVGGTKNVKVDVRIISSTNQDPAGLIEQKKFREDLFFRLNAFTIQLPPLRERREDIELLVNYFLKIGGAADKPKYRFSREALQILYAYHWPGNVRELKGVVSYAVNMTQSPVINPGSLPNFLFSDKTGQNRVSTPSAEPARPSFNLMEAIRDLERRLISEVLATAPNKSEAIKMLGISRRTFYLKLKEYGLTRL
ncbi:MAG TPA: two-component system response regulator [Synergistaceae bacterium]|nr:two-component system response regulator [Synergistaceae bacterium]